MIFLRSTGYNNFFRVRKPRVLWDHMYIGQLEINEWERGKELEGRVDGKIK